MDINRKNYRAQKYHAQRRGIQFNITYQDWLSWWGADINRRGNNSNDLCMARYGDTGPYELDNVYKTTIAQNLKDKKQKYNGEHPMAKKVMTEFGIFDSIKEASIASDCCADTLRKRIRNDQNKHYYLL